MIHVCFALYDKTGNYSKFTGTAMCSIFENLSTPSHSITIHILHNETLTRSNRDKFSYLAGRYRQIIKFYDVEKLCAEKINIIKNALHESFKERFSVAAMYRFLIPYLLSTETDKVIYLDSDVIFNLDINKLWLIELDNKPLGAIPNIFQGKNRSDIIEYIEKVSILCKDNVINVEDYFNSGVLLMNLKSFLEEENNIMSSIKFISEHPEYSYFDQDVLNYCFSKTYLRLPVEFNHMVKEKRRDKDFIIKKEIYHYAGGYWGLGLDLNDSFNFLWFNYFTKTPWFDASIISNLYKKVDGFGKQQRDILINFSVAMSGKIRVFVIDKDDDVNWLKKNYSIRDYEEVFIYKGEQSLQELIDEMTASHDKKIFFIRVNAQLIKSLNEAGFVEGENFFNHYTLFSTQIFTRKDRYSLILSM